MIKTKKSVSICLKPDIKRMGHKLAVSQKRSFSNYIETLICADAREKTEKFK